MSRTARPIGHQTRNRTQRRPRFEVLEARELLTGYTVTTTADSGPGSLREKITLANNDGQSGADSITFNIAASGVQTINLLTALPAITRPVAIDGTMELGYAGKPIVVISGSSVAAGADGLAFTGYSGESIIKGLSIGGFTATSSGSGGDGIFIAATSADNLIEGDYLGLAPDGKTATPNVNGVEVDSAGNSIGSTVSGTELNVISSNTGAGVLVSGNPASGNVILGDYIGVDASGTTTFPPGLAALGNGNGVVLAGPSNTVGALTGSFHDVISGNVGTTGTGADVLLEGSTAGNVVEGSYLGTDVTGSAAIESGFGYGIYLGTYGGSTSDLVSQDSIANNLISGTFVGIFGNATALSVVGTTFGLNSTRSTAIPNTIDLILGASGSTIGGVGASGNTISGAPSSVADGSDGTGINLTGDADLVQGNVIEASTVGITAEITNSTIGGTLSGSGNTITGSSGNGILINVTSTSLAGGNLIEGNTIGSATTALTNGSNGIAITVSPESGSSNPTLALADTIGGTLSGAGNTIVGNKGAGIVLENNYGAPVTGLTIQGNSIYGNAKLGIDLNGSGTPTASTFFLTSGSTSGGQTTLDGTFQGTPGVSYSVDFFGSTTPDASGFGQGQFYLGTAILTPDGAGLASINQTFTGVSGATSYSATVTGRDGSTSEFSLNLPSSTGVPTADLAVTGSSSPSSVAIGGALTFTETITNNGPSAATGVTFYDTLPTTFVNPSATSTSGTATISGQVVTDVIGSIAAGASVTVTIAGLASQSGSITNLAGASGTTLDSNYLNNEFSQVVTILPATTLAADLGITETASPTPATVGDNLVYTLTITNVGPASGTNVTVNDFLPSAATLVNVVPSQGGYASLNGTLITDNLGTIATGASATIQIVVKPTANGTLTNAANVSGNQMDPVSSNNSTTSTITVGGSTASPVLTLTQTPTPLIGTPGQIQLFTLTVHNTGTSAATGVTLVDALPTNATFVLAAPSQGGFASLANGVITDNLGTVAAGATATLTLVLVPTSSSILVNFAALVSGGAAPVYSQAFLVVPSGPSVTGVAGAKSNSQVVVNFNEPLTAGSASNPSNYKLYALGHAPRTLTSKDKPVKIKAISYFSQTYGVVFTPASPLDPTQYYTLVVVGASPTGITDVSGRKLIGSGSGTVGTNFTATFLASSLPQV